jgi:hypothetical protein
VPVVAEWDRATRSMLDGVHIIERIHARGALIKVPDKPRLDLTSPIGRGFIAFLSALAEDERQRIVRQANDGRKAAKARGAASRSPQAPPGRRERPSIGQVLQGAPCDHIEAPAHWLGRLSATAFSGQADGPAAAWRHPIRTRSGSTGRPAPESRVALHSRAHAAAAVAQSAPGGEVLAQRRLCA